MFLPERDQNGAGQGREVDHELRLVACPARTRARSASTSRPSASVLMISMVWPDMDLTMSPGRWAFAAGHVFDKADDADGVDLGLARGKRLHQPDDAGGARHIALHILHAGGRLDRNAAGVEADALADEGERLRLALVEPLPPRQRMTTTRLCRAEPCPTPSSAHMPSAFMAGSSRTSTSTPSFSSSLARWRILPDRGHWPVR